jgi:GMP synthase-like glutamine amidotransferase
MSANDGLPWIPQVFDLIRQAVDQSVPVLGHCLGGQLMSKALGGSITQNPVKEIGWGKVNKVDDSLAVDWLGPLPYQFEVFQWHGETFSIPPRAQRLLENSYCTNQAFLLNNKHLALQCHIEMTEAMIKAWCEVGSDEISNAKSSPAVESPSVIQANMSSRVKQLNTIADVIYGRWIQGFHSSESIKL